MTDTTPEMVHGFTRASFWWRDPDAQVIRVPRERPKFSLGRAIAWTIWWVIDLFMSARCAVGEAYPRWVADLPNRLTRAHLFVLLVPPLLFAAVLLHATWAAIVCFVAMVAIQLFDTLDGEIARYLDPLGSAWGRFWDPAVDKFCTLGLVIGWVVMLFFFFPLWMGFLAMMLGVTRLIEDGITGWYAKQQLAAGLDPKSGTAGKVKATDDAAGVGCGYLAMVMASSAPGSGDTLTIVGLSLLAMACIFALWSIRHHWRNLQYGIPG